MLSWLWFSMKFKYKLYVILHLKFIIILKLNESKKNFNKYFLWVLLVIWDTVFILLLNGWWLWLGSVVQHHHQFHGGFEGGRTFIWRGGKMKANQKLCSLWLQHHVIFRWCLTIWLNFTTKFFFCWERGGGAAAAY